MHTLACPSAPSLKREDIAPCSQLQGNVQEFIQPHHTRVDVSKTRHIRCWSQQFYTHLDISFELMDRGSAASPIDNFFLLIGTHIGTLLLDDAWLTAGNQMPSRGKCVNFHGLMEKQKKVKYLHPFSFVVVLDTKLQITLSCVNTHIMIFLPMYCTILHRELEFRNYKLEAILKIQV